MILDQLDETEMSLVSSYASFLIRNRGEHTEAYHRFQEFRERMLKKNPMTVEEIDSIMHAGDIEWRSWVLLEESW